MQISGKVASSLNAITGRRYIQNIKKNLSFLNHIIEQEKKTAM